MQPKRGQRKGLTSIRGQWLRPGGRAARKKTGRGNNRSAKCCTTVNPTRCWWDWGEGHEPNGKITTCQLKKAHMYQMENDRGANVALPPGPIANKKKPGGRSLEQKRSLPKLVKKNHRQLFRPASTESCATEKKLTRGRPTPTGRTDPSSPRRKLKSGETRGGWKKALRPRGKS